jgi:DNA-binding NarL/FixJ family response regulator
MQGKKYRSHEQELRQMEHCAPGPLADASSPFQGLSVRELGVMNELLRGATVKEIAERLDLRPTTVAT